MPRQLLEYSMRYIEYREFRITCHKKTQVPTTTLLLIFFFLKTSTVCFSLFIFLCESLKHTLFLSLRSVTVSCIPHIHISHSATQRGEYKHSKKKIVVTTYWKTLRARRQTFKTSFVTYCMLHNPRPFKPFI